MDKSMVEQPPESGADKGTKTADASRAGVAALHDEALDSLSKQVKVPGAPEQIRVLTFNIAEDGKFGLPGVIDLIRSSNADLVGLQESEENSAKIAKALGFHYVQHGYSALLTRLDIDGVTPGGNGIIVHTSGGKELAFFDKHLFYKPYQPYQLLGIPYENGAIIKTEAEAIAEAKKARGADVADLLKDADSLKDTSLPTILVGDFNEPSYLDWTEAAAKAGRHPAKVEWPSTKAFAEDGFQDSYRQLHPDEMAQPGFTWTPTTKPDDPHDHHDRIDYVLYRGSGIKPKSVEIVGENTQNADIVVAPYPSDHRAVTAVFELDGPSR
jgi:exodeoxyribonuclease III